MGWSFVPKEGKFFELFINLTDKILEAAEQYKLFTQEGVSKEGLYKKIKDIEHEGDSITHQTLGLLHKTFITPIDREDIHALVTGLDDVLDFIDAAAARHHMYGIEKVTEEVKLLADVSVRSAKELKKAVVNLENLKEADSILKSCIELHSLENEADHLYRLAMTRLFKEENDIKKLIQMKEVIELLELVTDHCEKVANTIEGIVVEYA